MSRSTYRFIALAIASFSLVACGAADDDTTRSTNVELVENGIDGNEATSEAQSLTRALLGDDLQTMDYPSSSNGTLLVPSDCATKTTNGNVHEFLLNHCSGPFGLAAISGKVTVTITSTSATEWHLAVVSEGLTINRTTADYEADAVVTIDGLQREMVWNGHLTGTTGRGRAVQRDGSWTVQWTAGSECVGIEGSATGNIAGRELQTTVTGFSRCKGSCPEAGGLLTITDQATGESVSISYDGSAEATFTGAQGRQGRVPLLCGQ